MKFVELDRTFSKPAHSENDYDFLRTWRSSSERSSWEDLLRQKRAVVLASAGSGKTEEFKQKAKQCAEKNAVGLFLAIEELADNSWEDCLTATDEKAFDQWRKGEGSGFFFLDSVDEAKLKDTKAFTRALRKLAKQLGDHAERAHIFISCRPSDWSEDADLQTTIEQLGIKKDAAPRPETEELTEEQRDELLMEPVLRAEGHTGAGQLDHKNKETNQVNNASSEPIFVTALDPLDRTRQQILASSTLADKSEQFLREVELKGLGEFAKRPSDMLDLCKYWESNGGFGSLRQMTEFNILDCLKERSGRKDGDILTDDEALEGAKKIAVALTLAKKLSILPPDSTSAMNVSESLDAADVLTNWTSAKREALLRRALFAPASFGRIRFQHRSMIEYLAAWQFSDMLRDEASRQKIENILFTTEFGIATIRPELRPIVSWMSLWDEKIRNKATAIEPTELIRSGDPKSLPIETRRHLLLSMSNKFEDGDVTNTDVDDRAVWLFSDDALAPEIRTAWSNTKRWQLRILLLEMIAAAKIEECADIALVATTIIDNHAVVAVHGLEALKSLSATSALKELAGDIVADKTSLDDDALSEFALRLFPDYLSVDDLFILIEKARAPKRFSTRGFVYRIKELFEKCPEKELETFLYRLSALTLRPPFKEDYERISEEFGYLTKYFTDIAHSALDRLIKPEASDGLVQLLVAHERGDTQSYRSDFKHTLSERIDERTELKRRLIWADIREVRRHETKRDLERCPWIRISVGFQGRLWGLSHSDASWLKSACDDQSLDQYERDTAFYLWTEIADVDVERSQLEDAANGNELREEWLKRRLSPTKPAWQKKEEERTQKAERKRLKRKGELTADWKSYQRKVRNHIPEADYSSGVTNEIWHFVDNLSRWLSWRENLNYDKAPRTWKALEPAFGEDVAKAYCEHLKKLWRFADFRRRKWHGSSSRGFKISEYAYGAIGLEADSDPDWASTLTETEARKASLILTKSDHAPPDWMIGLLEAHPTIFLPEFRKELKRQWTSVHQYPNDLVYYFAHAQEPIPESLQSIAFSVFINNTPGKPGSWNDAVRAIRRMALSSSQWKRFESVCRSKMCGPTATIEDRTRFLSVLILQDIDAAFVELERILSASSRYDRETILGLLFDGTHGHSLATEALNSANASTLERLTVLAFNYVKPKHDVKHVGAYTPGRRDFAEGARRTIFEALVTNETYQAYQALRRLSANKLFGSDRHWLKVSSKRKVEKAASLISWTPKDITLFLSGGDMPIQTAAQFFEICRAVLAAICDDFSSRDASSKKVFRRAASEDEVRDWLLEQLQLRSNGRYHAFREAQVHSEKRPDIIMAASSNSFQVALELKHSDKGWSARELQQTISDQLVGKYLRPAERRAGVLVVSRHKKQKWLSPKTKKYVDFSTTMDELRKYAADVQINHAETIWIDVIGVDTA